MELDITSLIDAPTLQDFSASIAETGNPDIGRDTWENAQKAAAAVPLLKTHEECVEARAYFREFGAWTAEELNAMSDVEVNALTLQYVAGEIREMRSFGYAKYRKLSDAGTCLGSIDKRGQKYYFYLGN